MWDDFLFNVKYGVHHVLDINAYDHVLFLIVLTVPYLFKDWKRVLLLVSTFTLGHTLSLVLASYDVVKVNSALVEFLIPLSIILVALFNVFTSGKGAQKDSKVGLVFFTTLFFGLIHGLGFAREFKMLVGGASNKLLVLIEFALGIEIAQVIIVFVVLLLGSLFYTFRTNKRDWVMVISAIVVGLTIPMILNSDLLS